MKLLLVDGYSLLYRAFFSAPPLTTKDGQPTGALFGFLKMVLRLLDEARPDYALVALDAHGPTFRHDSFAAYKAQRQAAPDDLRAQTRRVRELLDGLSIPHYEHLGFEADDILGTLAAHGAAKNIDVTIVTGDGDALQLASEKVRVMLTRRGVSDLEEYSPQEVLNRFGFEPKLLPDYKGLRGDTSDNIPGVPGIGEKTAMSLVSKFGGMEALYEHLEEVTPPRIRELLREHKAIAFESRDLARIVTDLPLDIEFDHCTFQNELDEPKRRRALETAREFEFKSLIARYEKKSSDDAPQESQTSELQQFALEKTSSEADVFAWLHAHDWGNSSGGIALLNGGEKSLMLGHGGAALLFSGEISELKSWLADAGSPKIAHDAKSLKLALQDRGADLKGVVADTLLMGYLLEPARQQHPIALLLQKYLGRSLPEIAAPEPKKKSKAAPVSLFEEKLEAEISSEPTDAEKVLAASACGLCDLAPVLRDELLNIGELELFQTLELPLVDVLAQMERAGMLLDVELLQRIDAKLEADAARLQSEIWELAGEEFNVGSTKQLQTILFEKLQLAKGRAIKSGYSTDVHTLEKLAEKHDIVRKILEYRGTAKLKATYVDGLLNGRDKTTNRIHTTLNQTGAVTGRLSSNPNLQNIPIRTAQGREIRRAFIAPKGRVLLSADYSQIELRILAHITGDEPLVEAFRTGEDVHARTAADLFGVEVSKVDAEMRRKAKMTNYAIAYGVSGFGLAKQLGTGSAGEAQEFINKYFETLPGVKKYIDDILEEARRNGFVQTLLGRRRPLPEINTPRHQERAAAERTAINHPIQGTSADIMKIAMLAVAEALQNSTLQTKMLMQVHDELVFEVPPDEIAEVSKLVSQAMREVPREKLQLKVPLEVDIGTGANWNDTKGKEEASEEFALDASELEQA